MMEERLNKNKKVYTFRKSSSIGHKKSNETGDVGYQPVNHREKQCPPLPSLSSATPQASTVQNKPSDTSLWTSKTSSKVNTASSKQLSLKSYFNKKPGSGAPGDITRHSKASAASVFPQRWASRPVAKVQPQRSPSKEIEEVLPVTVESKKPAVKSLWDAAPIDITDDLDDFDTSGPIFSPCNGKRKRSLIAEQDTRKALSETSDAHCLPGKQNDGSIESDEEKVLGPRRKTARRSVISDDEDEETQEPDREAPGVRLTAALPADQEPLMTGDSQLLDEEEGLMEIPPQSPPSGDLDDDFDNAEDWTCAESATQRKIWPGSMKYTKASNSIAEKIQLPTSSSSTPKLSKTAAMTNCSLDPEAAARKPHIQIAQAWMTSEARHTPGISSWKSNVKSEKHTETAGHSQDEIRRQQFEVLDEICEMVNQISTADLMSIQGLDYCRLQHLLALRKQLEDKQAASQAGRKSSQFSTSTPVIPNFKNISMQPSMEISTNCVLPQKDSFVSGMNRSLKRQSLDGNSTKSCSDLSSVDKKAPASRLSLPPGGDSFFSSDVQLSTQVSLVKTPVSNSRGLSADQEQSFNSPRTSLTGSFSWQSGSSHCDQVQFDYQISESVKGQCKRDSTASRSGKSGIMGERHDDISALFDSDGELDDTHLPDICNLTQTQDATKPAATTIGSFHSPVIKKTQTPTATQLHKTMATYTPTWKQTGNSFVGHNQDDGATGQFKGLHFPHSRDLMKVFSQVFGLKEFRKNQLETVNAALLGHDCFVLMPTGGGKSLCYQLPALVTPGVTVVISPLRSLIQDQVQRLCSLKVPATHLSSDVTPHQADCIYRTLSMREPNCKLLYVTPEKISASNKLLSALQNLYQRQRLSRFVIDEAHCVSQWGHDFRPDYKRLNVLREKFPGVPMMALTATATPRVRQDILHQLAMKDCKWFMQSFNRHNLKYKVLPKKTKSLTKEIVDHINKEFRGKSGIVYCLSRRECDQVAEDLCSAGIPAAAYHAGLSDGQRTQVQERWANDDQYKVVCATIAFGMGIDKPDVRFVMHYSLPKSVEGYYQESGRAGRDGLLATCILYYTYQDVARLRRMVEMDQHADWNAKKVHLDNLYRMVSYCENRTDCRRAQQLGYFGELFERKLCGTMPRAVCDCCESKEQFQQIDVTERAKLIVGCIRDILSKGRYNNYTLIHFMDVYRGSMNNKIKDAGHHLVPMHNKAGNLQRSDCERFFRQLVLQGILGEELHVTPHDHTVCYIKLGKRCHDLMTGNMKIELKVLATKQAQKEAAKTRKEQVNPRQELTDDCYSELVILTKELARENGYKNYSSILSSETLLLVARQLPITETELMSIAGMTRYKCDMYGARYLEVTSKYTALLASLDDEADVGDFDDASSISSNSTRDTSHYFDTVDIDPGVVSSGKSFKGGKKKFGGFRGRGKKWGGTPKYKRQKAAVKDKKAANSGSGASNRGTATRGRAGNIGGRGMGGGRGSTTGAGMKRPGLLGMPQTKTRSFLGSSANYMG